MSETLETEKAIFHLLPWRGIDLIEIGWEIIEIGWEIIEF